MPRHKKKGPKRRGGRISADIDTPILYRGRYTATPTAAISILPLDLNPLSLDPRLLSISDNYQNFRFVKVRARMAPSTAGAGKTAWIGYTPTLSLATAVYTDVPDMPCFASGNGTFGYPSPTLRLTKDLHENQPRWFRRGTAFDNLSESQGTLYFCWNDNATFAVTAPNFLIEYEVLLCGNIGVSFTSQLASASKASEKKEESDAPVLVTIHDKCFAQRDDPTPQELQQEIDGLRALLSVSSAPPRRLPP